MTGVLASAAGVLVPDDRVVIVATGSGFKESSAAESDVDPPTVSLAGIQDAVETRLSAARAGNFSCLPDRR